MNVRMKPAAHFPLTSGDSKVARISAWPSQDRLHPAAINSRRRWFWLRDVATNFACALALATAGFSQTYTITEVGVPATTASFATGVNASGQVAGYSTTAADAALAWRFTPGSGLLNLGSFGGTDSRAFGINNSGQVTGYSRDAGGLAHSFVFSAGTGLVDFGGFGNGEGTFPQHINASGQVVGFSPLGGNDRAFRFSPPNLTLDLGTIAGSTLPATAAAYGINDAGRVVGIASTPSGFNRAFRTDAGGGNIAELGTLGGDESWAYAINNAGQVAGTSDSLSIDTHAFLFTDGSGMTDLGTLGGYVSTAFALDGAGNVIGTAETASSAMHAFLWTQASAAMRDLNEYIPVNSGWVLTEARGVNDAGQIVGNGLLNGQPRAFLLTPNSGPDLAPPVAIAKAADITSLNPFAQFLNMTFWDDVSVLNTSVAAGAVRVTGPNGYNQLATFYDKTPATDGIKVAARFYVGGPGGTWNGAANGVYSISVEPNVVRDVAGNFMPGGVVGTFTVATETKPVITIGAGGAITMAVPTTFTLSALSSFPYAPGDVFNVSIDWKNDGSDVQTITGPTGTTITHTFTSIGQFTIRVVGTDPHGVSSGDTLLPVFVGNAGNPQVWSAAPALTGSRRLAVGLNTNGTLLCLGGLPLKSGRDIVNSLAPGAGAFVDAQRLPAPTIGLGAGIDSLNRVIVFGGIEPGAATANTNGYVYTTGGGAGAAIAAKTFAVHDFAFATDNLHRLYSIGGATGSGTTAGTSSVERYDASTNSWTTLAPLPEARVSALGTYDGHGHIVAIGGIEPVSGLAKTTVFSYDIGANTWSQLSALPSGSSAGCTAALGADGLVYVIGGTNSAAVLVFDTVADAWYAGPPMSTPRGNPAVALGNDGFLYAMGGDNVGNGNNGLATVEKIDTSILLTPQIISSPGFPGTTVPIGNLFSYKVIALGNPRPSFSLVTGPAGMTINSVGGLLTFTPAANQVGNSTVIVRATSTSGIAEQTFTVTVPPPPGDVTPPTAPASISLVFRNATSVTLTWPAATDDVGVVSYNIYGLFRGSRSSHIGLIRSGLANRSYIAATGALAYYAAAVDAAGNISARSPGVSASVLTLPVITHTIFSEPSTIIQGNGFLYTLSASANPGPPTFTTLSGPAGMTLTRTTGPNPLQDYAVVQWQPTAAQLGTFSFTVSASNPNTTGASVTYSVTVLPNGTDTIPPTPVAQLTASAISFDRCTLSWTAAGDNIGVTNYRIVATHFGVPNHVVTLNIPGNTLTTPLTGLLASAGYTVAITPSDAAGNIGPSTSIFFTTLTQPVTNFRLSAGTTASTFALDWNGGGSQWSYVVESTDSLATPNWVPISASSSSTHFVITPAVGAPMGFFRVKATTVSP